ncbi:HlyC/CorC family transporter [Candidatus Sumerlaeota bacterium]|nr:HlyC/CorC family transporter [Candidatus Sumerlaeota bacterium]
MISPLLILMLFFLVLSGFFSGSETALFSLNKMQLSHLTNHRPRLSKAVVKLLDSPNETLTAILLGNTLVNIGAALCAGILAEKFIRHSPVLSFFIGAGTITIVILIVGEIIPKSLAISHSETVSLVVSLPLLAWYYLIFPFRQAIHLFTDSVLRLIRITPSTSIATLNEEELKVLLSTSEITNILPEDEQEMIEGVLELGETTVEEVMTPRTEIEAYPIDINPKQLLEALKSSKHNRVIIFNQRIDNIVGVLHVKDFFLNPDKPLASLLREPLLVPPKKLLITMLAEFRRARSHLAVVVDEYGGTEGIITLQDVLEEIVWELEDTGDRKVEFIQKIGEGDYRVSGTTKLWRINEELGLHLPEDVAHTIAGFVVNSMQRIPELGEELVLDNLRFIVEKKTKRRLTQIRIQILPKGESTTEYPKHSN